MIIIGIMNKKTIITVLLALVALTGQAKELTTGMLPADWFTTDSVTIRGRIEDYDAERLGFSAMECYLHDVTVKDRGSLTMDINPDGTFEKRFVLSYPMKLSFSASYKAKTDFDRIPFFARPGEVVDVTVRQNELGKYECFYNGGSSKDVERWLKTDLQLMKLTRPLSYFKGTLAEANQMADTTWQKLVDRFGAVSRREQFTPLETRLAMAEIQSAFAWAYLDYVMYHGDNLMEWVLRDGSLQAEISDSTEWLYFSNPENYTALRRIDFNNPWLMTYDNFHVLINRIQFSKYVYTRKYEGVSDGHGFYETTVQNETKILSNTVDALCAMLGTDSHNLTVQLCIYTDLLGNFNSWRQYEEELLEVLADTTVTETEKQDFPTLTKMYPLYLAALTHPHIHKKAEQFRADKMAQAELATPLPGNPAADLIRQMSAKYPGRYLFIDFWGMGCGPCRAAIQQSKAMRAELAKRDDVKLVFIAEERTAEGSEAYHKYVGEWLADEETVCLDRTAFRRLQELFRFTSIPHYETITPDCRRVRDDLCISSYYNIDDGLKQLKEKLK